MKTAEKNLMAHPWNCSHLANANKKKHLRRLNECLRLNTLEIITPLELMED